MNETPSLDANNSTQSAMRQGSPDASAVIWNWQSPETKPAVGSGARRTKGVLQGVVGLVVGTLLYFFVSEHMGMLAWSVSSFILISAALSPDGAYAAIERVLDWLVDTVGTVVTWLVMVPIFYLIFLPFGMLFRRGQNDAMKRYYDDGAKTYWVTRASTNTPEDRERLF